MCIKKSKNNFIKIFLLGIIFYLKISFLQSSFATSLTFEHKVLQRLAVFPIQLDPKLGSIGDDAWWSMREQFTEGRRFMVASKSFMIQKDVFESRAELSPADAIVIGRLLDAQAIVVTYLKDRELFMKVYEGEYGRLLWEGLIYLQNTAPISQQISGAVFKLTSDFIASVPYQGFVKMDDMVGDIIIRENGKIYLKIELVETLKIEIGDEIQLIKVVSDSLRPLFMDGQVVQVFGEGRVVNKNKSQVLVEVLRVTKLEDIKKGSLVRVPRVMEKLKENYSIQSEQKSITGVDILSPKISSREEKENEVKPLVTSSAFLLNLTLFLLLAF